MTPYFQAGGITLYCGDNREVIPKIPDAMSAVVTDPPYGLSFMGRDWDHGVPGQHFWEIIGEIVKPGAHLLAFGGTRTEHRLTCAIEDAGFEIRDKLLWLYGSGFPKSLDVGKAIDKQRDDRDPVLAVTRWINAEVKRAGIRYADILGHFGFHQGSGQIGHWTALSLGAQPAVPTWDQWLQLKTLLDFGDEMDAEVWRLNGRKGRPGDNWDKREVIGQKTSAIATPGDIDRHTVGGSRSVVIDITAPATDEAKAWNGWGTALKPAHEPIVLARKPLSGTVAANVLAHGTGAINVDASRVQGEGGRHREGEASQDRRYTERGGTNFAPLPGPRGGDPAGRWPANVLLDPEAAAMLDEQSGERGSSYRQNGTVQQARAGQRAKGDEHVRERGSRGHNDIGGASRFFPVLPVDDPETVRFKYTPKASRAERNAGLDGMPEKIAPSTIERHRTNPNQSGESTRAETRTPKANHHPTVKPLALMRWLITLVTPPGGVILDPFAGSGSTLVAAAQLGVEAVGIEMIEEYCEIAKRRILHALSLRDRKPTGPRQSGLFEMVAD